MFVGKSFQILAPLYAKLFMYMSLCFPLGWERLLQAEVLVSLEWLSCTYLNISDIYTGARPFRLLSGKRYLFQTKTKRNEILRLEQL